MIGLIEQPLVEVAKLTVAVGEVRRRRKLAGDRQRQAAIRTRPGRGGVLLERLQRRVHRLDDPTQHAFDRSAFLRHGRTRDVQAMEQGERSQALQHLGFWLHADLTSDARFAHRTQRIGDLRPANVPGLHRLTGMSTKEGGGGWLAPRNRSPHGCVPD